VDQNRDVANHLRLQYLQIFQLEAQGSVRRNRLIGPREFAFMLVSIGLISLLLATLEYRQNIRALGAQYAANNAHSRWWLQRSFRFWESLLCSR
jgi:hypothetical protein